MVAEWRVDHSLNPATLWTTHHSSAVHYMYVHTSIHCDIHTTFSHNNSYPYKVSSLQGPFGGGQGYSPKGDTRAGRHWHKISYVCKLMMAEWYICTYVWQVDMPCKSFRIDVECNVLPILGFIRHTQEGRNTQLSTLHKQYAHAHAHLQEVVIASLSLSHTTERRFQSNGFPCTIGSSYIYMHKRTYFASEKRLIKNPW